MAANNSWTGYETWARVFLFSKNARCCDTESEPMQNCSYLCHRSIATKREMIRFTVVPPRRESRFFNDFIIRHQSYMEPASAGSEFICKNDVLFFSMYKQRDHGKLVIIMVV